MEQELFAAKYESPCRGITQSSIHQEEAGSSVRGRILRQDKSDESTRRMCRRSGKEERRGGGQRHPA